MIRLLSEDTIQKIAAGEVIERPVSVVKELIENAIDAGADSISVEISKGGKDYIRVTDNGSGIGAEDFETAFLRHATSKIQNFEDLYRIHSLGFRGEALASIIAVARVTARSRTEEERLATELTFENSKRISKKQIAMAVGTEMVVEDLFYNVPVRKRFLKTDAAEGNRISSLLYSLAVGNPKISFHFIKDDKLVFQTRKERSFNENLMLLFGMAYYDALLEVEGENDLYRIRGRIGNNTFYRANRQLQFLFVNGRLVEDQNVRDLIENEYRSIIPNGRFPAFQIFIETDPANIDINIHPNKQKIKFNELGQLEQLIRALVRKKLLDKPATTSLQSWEETGKERSRAGALPAEDSYKKILSNYQWLIREEETAKAGDEQEAEPETLIEDEEDGDLFEVIEIEGEEEGLDEDFLVDDLRIQSSFLEPVMTAHNPVDQEADLDAKEAGQAVEKPILPDPDRLELVGSAFKTYLIFEQYLTDDLLIIDQHAAHERINYERFMKQFKSRQIVSQQYMQAIALDLTEIQMNLFHEKVAALEEMGFSFTIQDDRSVVLRAVPTLFAEPEGEDLFYALVDMPVEGYESMEEIVAKLAVKACKASVKQGDRLQLDEIRKLYTDLAACDYPLTCPHGRPTAIFIHKSEIEKIFMRIK